MRLIYTLFPIFAGSKLVSSHSMHETSSVMVDPVTRAISCSQPGAPTQSDASKVLAKGLGLTKGFIGQKNSFSVDCSKAGVCVIVFFLFFSTPPRSMSGTNTLSKITMICIYGSIHRS